MTAPSSTLVVRPETQIEPIDFSVAQRILASKGFKNAKYADYTIQFITNIALFLRLPLRSRAMRKNSNIAIIAACVRPSSFRVRMLQSNQDDVK